MKKLYNKTLIITTKDKETYIIERKNVFIHGSSLTNSNLDILKKDNNIYVIKEIYSYEDSRIRFSYTEYVNAKVFDTIEKIETGSEIPVMVIENYDKVQTLIGSIGNINELISDTIEKNNEKHKDKPKILKLLRKNKTEENISVA